LVHRYAADVDDRQFDSVAELFTFTAELTVPEPPAELRPIHAHRGRAAIVAAVATVAQTVRTEHAIVGEVYDEVPGSRGACGRIACIAHHWTERADEVIDVVWHLRYDDEDELTDAGWRISRRALTILAIETRPVRRLLPRDPSGLADPKTPSTCKPTVMDSTSPGGLPPPARGARDQWIQPAIADSIGFALLVAVQSFIKKRYPAPHPFGVSPGAWIGGPTPHRWRFGTCVGPQPATTDGSPTTAPVFESVAVMADTAKTTSTSGETLWSTANADVTPLFGSGIMYPPVFGEIPAHGSLVAFRSKLRSPHRTRSGLYFGIQSRFRTICLTRPNASDSREALMRTSRDHVDRGRITRRYLTTVHLGRTHGPVVVAASCWRLSLPGQFRPWTGRRRRRGRNRQLLVFGAGLPGLPWTERVRQAERDWSSPPRTVTGSRLLQGSEVFHRLAHVGPEESGNELSDRPAEQATLQIGGEIKRRSGMVGGDGHRH
jgi:hypothetical protein